MSYWQLVWWRVRRDKVTLTAAAVILCIVLSALLAPYLAPYDPFQGSIRTRLAQVGTQGHFLGTDEQGRDMLSRLLFGGRLSLTAGVVPVCVALCVGATLGILAGFMGRGVNMLIMRTMDIFYAFPSVLLAIAISGALGASVGNTIIALSIVFTPPITRIAESVTTQVRGWEFMGDPPNPINPPSGCRFRTRCPHAMEQCAATSPPLLQVGSHDRYVACYLYSDQTAPG